MCEYLVVVIGVVPEWLTSLVGEIGMNVFMHAGSWGPGGWQRNERPFHTSCDANYATDVCTRA